LGISKKTFIESEREFPVNYNNKVDFRIVSFINVPDGYKVDFLPEKLIMSLPNRTGQYTYEAILKYHNDSEKQIMINTSFKISKSIFVPEEYGALKHFYDLVIQKQNEKIILKKEN